MALPNQFMFGGTGLKWVDQRRGLTRGTAPSAGGGLAGGAGGGAGGSSYANLQAMYGDAFEKARQANLARYEQIDRQRGDLIGRGMGYLTQLGQQGAADIDRRAQARTSTLQQDLISRGLGNTSIPASMQIAQGRETEAEHRRFQEDLARERLAADMGLTEQQAAFRERRTDAYPDLNQLIELSSRLGAGGAGGGGGYGGGGMTLAAGTRNRGPGFVNEQVTRERSQIEQLQDALAGLTQQPRGTDEDVQARSPNRYTGEMESERVARQRKANEERVRRTRLNLGGYSNPYMLYQSLLGGMSPAPSSSPAGGGGGGLPPPANPPPWPWP